MNADANLKDIYFYRDNKKREIDLVTQNGRTLHHAGIKATSTIGKEATVNFDRLKQFTDYEVEFGHVICQTETPCHIINSVQAILVWAI